MGLFGRNSHEILNEEKELLTRSDPNPPKPPTRLPESKTLTPDEIMSLSIIFRGHQIHQTAAKQCTIYGVENEARIPKSKLPSTVKRPVLKYTFREYLARTISSLYRHGNRYSLKQFDANGNVEALIPLNTSEVTLEVNSADPTTITAYLYRGVRFRPSQISHLRYVEIDDFPLGISAFGAANIELRGMYDTRNYTRRWLQENAIPLEGYLKSLYDVDDDEAKKIKERWQASVTGMEGIAVLPQGIDFEPLYLKPSELQWVDVQKFDAIQQVRMTTAPASTMLVNVEGSTQVYQNVEQDWIGYTRYGLMAYLLPIEDELSDLAPETMDIKFNVDALLRSDTLSRYQAHAIATAGKPFMTPEEIRLIEDRENTPEIIAQLDAPKPQTQGGAQ